MVASARRVALTETGRGLHLGALASVSIALLAVRIHAAAHVGFGDAEALYASYALHPQPAYLDHPGLIGVVARAIGGGTAPSPARAHVATVILATLFPWLMALACRAGGATWKRSLSAAVVVALVPEIAIGLFGMTPDALLALAWTGAMALAAVGLRSRAGSARATVAFGAAGVLAGVATASHVTGAALLVAMAASYVAPACRSHARSVAPWAGLAAGTVVVWPVISFEATRGWPMLHHRLIDTQAAAGLSFRNAGAWVSIRRW
jgi:hypothetical protein